jgi:hypothetical protein
MIDEKDIKKGIGMMYYRMGKCCIKTSEAIEEDLDKYVITERKMGNELKVADGRKYQLILELKRVD